MPPEAAGDEPGVPPPAALAGVVAEPPNALLAGASAEQAAARAPRASSPEYLQLRDIVNPSISLRGKMSSAPFGRATRCAVARRTARCVPVSPQSACLRRDAGGAA